MLRLVAVCLIVWSCSPTPECVEGACQYLDSTCGRGYCNPEINSCAVQYLAAGTACGDEHDDACTQADTCDGAGACRANDAPAGTPCSPASECRAAGTCDGAGACSAPAQPAGTPCGPQGVCRDQATCDGAGACVEHFKPAGTPCGDQRATPCTAPDTCDAAGACLPNDSSDPECAAIPSPACAYVTCNSGACTTTLAAPGTSCGEWHAESCWADQCDALGQCVPVTLVGTICGMGWSRFHCVEDRCDSEGVCRRYLSNQNRRCTDNSTVCFPKSVCRGEECVPVYAPNGSPCGSCGTGACTCSDGECHDHCGDGIVQPDFGEQCDGTDDTSCPGACVSCACPPAE
jgi:hypothetical protein